MFNQTIKNPHPIQLLSFDLDNTLYDNREVIINAEQVSRDFLIEAFDKQNQRFKLEAFQQIRDQLAATDDPQYEDMSYLRQQALAHYCQPLKDSNEIAEQAFQVFLQARSQAKIEPRVLTMLEQLSKQYILISATNGNCDATQLSLNHYFKKHYSASQNQSQQPIYRAKPHPQMLEQAMSDFKLAPENILHLGDSIAADQKAAENAGVSFYYFAPFADGVNLAEQCDLLLEQLESN